MSFRKRLNQYSQSLNMSWQLDRETKPECLAISCALVIWPSWVRSRGRYVSRRRIACFISDMCFADPLLACSVSEAAFKKSIRIVAVRFSDLSLRSGENAWIEECGPR